MSAAIQSHDDIARYRSALLALDPGMAREQWVRVAMAAKASGLDFEDFDGWSALDDSYNARDAAATWKSVGADGGIGPGTLIEMAKQSGWRYEGQRVQLSAAEIAKRDAERAQRREREAVQKAVRHAEAAGRANKIWSDAKPSDGTHPYLLAKGIGANGARVGDWPVIDPDTGEIRYTVKNALLLQVRDFDKRVHSAQAIIERAGEDGRRESTKLFLPGGAKRGHFCPIGQPVKGADGRLTFVVAEGFATAASVHEATGHGCVVAFDAGNLGPVCREIRARFPDARILLVGDRDAKAHAQSTGSRKAADAALEVGACLFVPEWTGAGRDANDILLKGFQHEWIDIDGKRQTVDISGPDHLQACIDLALAAGPLRSEGFKRMMEGLLCESPQPVDGVPEGEAEARAGARVGEADDCDPEDDTAPGENPFANNRHFRVLGVDGDTYFFFRKGRRNQILSIRTSGLSMNALLSLAPLNWWETVMLDAPSGKFAKDAAVGFLMEAAEAAGIMIRRSRAGAERGGTATEWLCTWAIDYWSTAPPWTWARSVRSSCIKVAARSLLPRIGRSALPMALGCWRWRSLSAGRSRHPRRCCAAGCS